MRKLPLASICFVASLAGCAHHDAEPANSEHAATITASDGVPIVYAVQGQGELPLVFIHCWGGDRSYWDSTVADLSRDYRCVTLDLPGHGASGAGRQTWSIAGLAADVERLIEHLGLRRFILVGHSMGGPIGLEVARRMPGRAVALIAVDTLHDAELVWPEESRQQILAAFENDFEATLRQFLGGMIADEANPAVRERVLATALQTDRNAAIGLMHGFDDVELPVAMKAARVPIRAINAAPRPPLGPETKVTVNRRYADFDAVIMPGVGHYPMLENPAEFHARLREALGKLPKS